MLTISRKISFDSGHRIPDHNSKCRNLHGHHYVMNITLHGDLITTKGNPYEGMIIDFYDIKLIAQKYLINKWDHAFFVYKEDNIIKNFLETLPDHKTIILDNIPTVENLANTAFEILSNAYKNYLNIGLKLKSLKLYETPNCWAEVIKN